jgi:hypothetical protein
LALVALAIGFNTSRYPIVWEMLDPARAGPPAQPAAASQPEKAETPAPAAAPPTPEPKPIAVAPVPEMTDKTIADNSAPPAAKASGQDTPNSHANENGIAASNPENAAPPAAEPETPQKPLVPVALVSTSAAPAGAQNLRRLPPVDQADSSQMGRDAAQSPGGSIPVYPSTGIE